MCIGHKAKIRDKIPMRSSFLLLPRGEGKGCNEYVGVSAPKPPCPSQRLPLSHQQPRVRGIPAAHGVTLKPHPLRVTQGQLPSMGSSCYRQEALGLPQRCSHPSSFLGDSKLSIFAGNKELLDAVARQRLKGRISLRSHRDVTVIISCQMQREGRNYRSVGDA